MIVKQHNVLIRKNPKQDRAKKTIQTLLMATAQILSEEGSESLTTNYLAHKAGFSIGTVYQYFPNKAAIVLALIEQQREETGCLIRARLDAQPDSSLEDKIRAVVSVLHEAFSLHRMSERRLTRALTLFALAHGLPDPPNVAVMTIITLWAESNAGEGRSLNQSEVFVLTRAVVEVLRQAIMQATPLLGTAEFENALFRLIMSFLDR